MAERSRLAILGWPAMPIVLTLFVAFLLIVPMWFCGPTILRSAARSWVVSDPVEAADAVAILGGEVYTRPFAAAELFKSGLARLILLDLDESRKALLELNIPSEAIEQFGDGLRNTYEEACALASWAKLNRAKRIIIPTEPFPSRRMQWVFTREFAQIGVGTIIDTVASRYYAVDGWWMSTQGTAQFRSEIFKYFYYRARYLFAPHC